MLERFAGRTPEARARVIAEEPCSDSSGFTIGHARVGDGGQTIV